MSETTYYQRKREVMLNRANEYYENNKEVLKERAKINIDFILRRKKYKERIWKKQIS